MTAHFWVSGRLYEVDYDRAGRFNDGGPRLVRVHGSERRCRCPGRDEVERERRARRMNALDGPIARATRTLRGR